MKKAFNWFFTSNEIGARFLRTVLQGVIAAVIAALTTGEWGATFVVAAIMAVLSPVMALLNLGGTGFDEKVEGGEE